MRKLSIEIRIEIIKMLVNRGFGHIGGSLSIVDVLAVLYGEIMQINPKKPDWEDRDYFVLSKGHAGPALYATLALKGYFDKTLLMTLNEPHTKLPSHCDRLLTPGIDMTTGSLGQGISVAVGIAKALKIQGKTNRVFCIIGDGELNEGQPYEAIQFAAHHKLDNLVLFVDENKLQLDGYTKDICNQGDLVEKFKTFQFDARRCDGHSHEELVKSINQALLVKNKPSVIILDTVKGKGVPFLENQISNHHVRFSPEQITKLEELVLELESEIL
jgi:transketolase